MAVDNDAAEKLEAQALQLAHDFLEDVATKIRALGHTTRGTSVLGTPASMILYEAETLGADLIMVGTQGRQGLARFVLSNVSHAVLHQAQSPVLVFEYAVRARHGVLRTNREGKRNEIAVVQLETV